MYNVRVARTGLDDVLIKDFTVLFTYLSLEGAPQSNYKGVLGKSEDVPLVEDLLDLLLHDHTMLAHLLHGKPLVSIFVTNKIHSTE